MRTAVVHVTVTEEDDGRVVVHGVVDAPETDGWAVRELLLQMMVGAEGMDVTECSVIDVNDHETKLI